MLYPNFDGKMAVDHIDSMIQEVKDYRQDKQLRSERDLRLPKLSSLFANKTSENKKFEQKTAVACEAS